MKVQGILCGIFVHQYTVTLLFSPSPLLSCLVLSSPPQLQSLQSQLEFQEQSMVEKSMVSRQDAKIREIETKLEFEKTQVKRLEVSAHLRWKGRRVGWEA